MTKTIQERIDEIIDAEEYMGIEEYNLFLQKTIQEVHTQAVEEERKKMLVILSKLRDVDGDFRLKMVQEFTDNIYTSTPSLTNKQNV